MEVNPPLPEMSETAPSLQAAPGTPMNSENASLVAQEPAMTSGTLASITTVVGSVAIILKYVYGLEVGNEVIDAIINVIMVAITGLAPLIAAKFTRERATPVN